MGKGRKAAKIPVSGELRATLDSWRALSPHGGTDPEAPVTVVVRRTWGQGRRGRGDSRVVSEPEAYRCAGRRTPEGGDGRLSEPFGA